MGSAYASKYGNDINHYSRVHDFFFEKHKIPGGVRLTFILRGTYGVPVRTKLYRW